MVYKQKGNTDREKKETTKTRKMTQQTNQEKKGEPNHTGKRQGLKHKQNATQFSIKNR